jgi:hypothetical protein
MPDHQAGALELGQHAVHRRQPHFLAHIKEFLVYLLRGHVRVPGSLENAQDLQARQRRLESGLLELSTACIAVAHG